MLWRWRHVFLALGLAAGTLALVNTLSPDDGAPALILAADRPAGHPLGSGDLRTVTLTPPLPSVLTSPDDAAGRILAVGLPAGTPLTEGMLVGPTLAESAPPGSTVVTVAVADPGSRELAVPGTRVTLVGTDPSSERVTQTPDVLVLSRFDPAPGGGLLASESEFTFLLVAVPREATNFVVQTSAAAPLRVALVSEH